MSKIRVIAVFLALHSFLTPSAARADDPPLPLGDEFLVTSTTTGDQARPEVASNTDGDFIAVWQSDGEDGNGLGIYVQLFDLEGLEVGVPILVNTTITGDQSEPAISADDSGDFVVAWQSADASSTGIFARYFEEDGVPDTGEIAVNTTSSGAQTNASLAQTESGNFLVVWQGPDGSGDGIFARLFDNNGNPLSAEFAVNTTTSGAQELPQVKAFDETNGFFVVWEGPDASGSGIYLQRLSSSGAFLGSETLVNTTTAGNQRRAAVAVSGLDTDPLNENRFVVVWESPDSAGNGIWAQIYADDGTPIGGEQLVNDDDSSNQSDPSVAVDNGGDADGIDFVVSFTEAPILGRGSPIFIRGRRLNSIPPVRSVPESGVPGRGLATAEFAISQAGDITAASLLAVEDDGDFVAIWQSQDQDGSGLGVYARRFAGQPIFADGFEGGDTSRWSFTLP